MQTRLFSTNQTRLQVDLAPQRGAIAVCVIGKRSRRLRQDLGLSFPVGAPPATQHLSNQVFVRTIGDANASAVARELGHYPDLCAIDGPDPWAFHPTADHKVAGTMVSCRQLNQDVTLDETNRARTSASSGAKLYAP
jgi:hypothetical protein